MRFFALLSLLFLSSFQFVTAQGDSTSHKKVIEFDTTHSPKKAMILSAVLPGAGQIYNHKYWKVPVIYAAMGTSLYFILDNSKQYKNYRTEYVYRLNNNGAVSNLDLADYSESQLRILTDQYRTWRDLSYVVMAGFYVLQIIDATVDGYLWRHDTSPNLSFEFRPSFVSTAGGMAGFRFRIKF